MTNNFHVIDLNEAIEMTHSFQMSDLAIDQTVSCLIDKSAYELLMNQSECASVRTYFSLNSSNKLTIVVVGVDANGNDLTAGIILNRGFNCPTRCPINSELML